MRYWNEEPDGTPSGDLMIADGSVWATDKDGDWYRLLDPPPADSLELTS